MKSEAASDYLTKVDDETPSDDFLKESKLRLVERESEKTPSMNVVIGEVNPINVIVYFTEVSEYEPYVTIEPDIEKSRVLVVINRSHPHFIKMSNRETVTNFIRHCVYDGVAEWKAIKLTGEIKPDTVKFLKDGLLRLEYQVTN